MRGDFASCRVGLITSDLFAGAGWPLSLGSQPKEKADFGMLGDPSQHWDCLVRWAGGVGQAQGEPGAAQAGKQLQPALGQGNAGLFPVLGEPLPKTPCAQIKDCLGCCQIPKCFPCPAAPGHSAGGAVIVPKAWAALGGQAGLQGSVCSVLAVPSGLVPLPSNHRIS